MSGHYSVRTGVYTVGGIERFDWQQRPLRPVDNVTELPLDRQTIADQLKSAGYATGMFGKWHIGQKGAYQPSRRGFMEAIVTMGKHFDFETNPQTNTQLGILADFLTDRARRFHPSPQERAILSVPAALWCAFATRCQARTNRQVQRQTSGGRPFESYLCRHDLFDRRKRRASHASFG